MPSPPKPTKPPKFNTLTTAGRIAKAAHDREQATSKLAATSPPPESPTTKKKSCKIPVLAPPAELEAEATRRAEAKKTKKPPKKPLTTQEKIAASKKVKQTAVPTKHDGKSLKAVRGEESKEKGGVRAAKGEKPRNLMDIMRELGQISSAIPVPATSTVDGKVQTVASGGARGGAKGKAKVKESVLVRPTERTRRMQQSLQHQDQMQMTPAASFVKVKCEDESPPSSNSQASLMGLPLELRQRIWHLAVVESQFFVYPAINHEQPDLAMTNRQIRNEVLPLYYGQNTFAIEVPASPGAAMSRRKAKDSESLSLVKIEKWMAALTDREYLGTIRKWAFTWAPLVRDVRLDIEHGGSREVIVSICYPKPEKGNGQIIRPEIEIHRQAFCLLKGHELFHPCVCTRNPAWLDDAVIGAILAEAQNRGKQILMIAKGVGKKGAELVGSRCEDDVVESK